MPDLSLVAPLVPGPGLVAKKDASEADLFLRAPHDAGPDLNAYRAAPFANPPAQPVWLGVQFAGRLTGVADVSGSVSLSVTCSGTLTNANPADFLGTACIEWFGSNYSTSTGTWTGSKASKTYDQATVANRPATTTSPDGSLTVLDFDGAAFPNNDALVKSGGAIGAPGGAGVGEYLWSCIFKSDDTSLTGVSSQFQRGTDTFGINIDLADDGKFWVLGAKSDASVLDSSWHVATAICTESTGNVRLWIDSVLQSATSTGSMRTEFLDAGLEIGSRPGTGANPFNGQLGSMVYAYTATTFSAGTISGLNSIQQGYITAPAPSGALSGSFTASISPAATLTGAGSLTGSTTASVSPAGTLVGAGALTGSSSASVTFSGTATATAAATGSFTASLSPSGTLTGTGALTGSSAVSVSPIGTLTGAGALSGSSALSLVLAATGTSTFFATGSFTASVSPAGTLAGAGALTGATSAALTLSSALTGAGALTGSSAISVSSAGTLKGAGALSGSSAISISPSGTLTGAGALTGSASVAVTFSGTLTAAGSGAMSGSVSISISPAGTLTGAGALTGSTSAAISPAGTLTGSAPATGSVAISVSPIGTLTGTGDLAGLLSIDLTFSGTTTDLQSGIFLEITLNSCQTFTHEVSPSSGFNKVANPVDKLAVDIDPCSPALLLVA